MYVKGLSQQQIGTELGVTQKTVSCDLAIVREQWRASALMDFQERQALELARLDDLERTARAAFERSLSDQITETIKSEVSGNRIRSNNATSKRNTSGDVRYLDTIARCIELRSKICGILKPANVNVATAVSISWDALAGELDAPTETIEQKMHRILNAPATSQPIVLEHQPIPSNEEETP